MQPILLQKIGSPDPSSPANETHANRSDGSPPQDDSESNLSVDVPRVKLKDRGWTLGNSASLVEGSEPEPPWVSIAWIVIPCGIVALLLLVLLQA